MGDGLELGDWLGIRRLLEGGDAWLSHRLGEPFANLPLINRLFGHARISARGLLIASLAVVVFMVVPPLIERLLRRQRCVAVNFRGESIPQSFGVAILVCAALMLGLIAWMYPVQAQDRLTWLFCIVAFGLLGVADDLFGDKKVKGLRGHLNAFLRGHRITTGLIKAVGGLLVAFCIGLRLHGGDVPTVLLATCVIALSANAMNLLDLRPGRACGAFCVSAVVLLAAGFLHDAPSPPSLLYVWLPALITWPRDARARVMLGDAGSNLLGASLGLAICVYAAPVAQIAILAALAILHVVAERVSITKVIEGNRFLRAIDRLTGIR